MFQNWNDAERKKNSENDSKKKSKTFMSDNNVLFMDRNQYRTGMQWAGTFKNFAWLAILPSSLYFLPLV